MNKETLLLYLKEIGRNAQQKVDEAVLLFIIKKQNDKNRNRKLVK